jgi:hypothetical protein
MQLWPAGPSLRLSWPGTLRSVHLARYAARSVGFTAVPVIQGMPAVATTTTCLQPGRAACDFAAVNAQLSNSGSDVGHHHTNRHAHALTQPVSHLPGTLRLLLPAVALSLRFRSNCADRAADLIARRRAASASGNGMSRLCEFARHRLTST